MARRPLIEPVSTSMGCSSSDIQGCRSQLCPQLRLRRGGRPLCPCPLRASVDNHVMHGPKYLLFNVHLNGSLQCAFAMRITDNASFGEVIVLKPVVLNNQYWLFLRIETLIGLPKTDVVILSWEKHCSLLHIQSHINAAHAQRTLCLMLPQSPSAEDETLAVALSAVSGTSY
jgi:hypothetical protein